MAESSHRRIWAFRAVLIVLIGIGAEAAAFATLSVLRGGLATPRQVSIERRSIRKGLEGAGAEGSEAREGADSGAAPRTPQLLPDVVIHPYLGYTFDPARSSEEMTSYWKRGRRINRHGFIGTDEPLARVPGERFVVAVLGGSVALELTIDGTDRIADKIRRSPRVAGREVEIVTLAVNGYKQPQQLMALAYYLSLGAHFDLVVNLDGFNEIVLPQVEHERFEVFPFYPRSWYWRVQEVPDPALRRAMGAVSYLEDQRRVRAKQFSRRPWRYSSVWNLAWKVIDRRLQDRIASAREVLFGSAGGGDRSAAAQGPPFTAYEDREAMLAELADHWARCSIAMHDLCEARGIPYVHFLQPNQYVPGSKPIGAEERAVAVQEGGRLQRAVVAGYPSLISAAASLVNEGVAFHDLTGVFAEIEAALYGDTCCHLNEEGNRRLGEAIGEILVGTLSTE